MTLTLILTISLSLAANVTN